MFNTHTHAVNGAPSNRTLEGAVTTPTSPPPTIIKPPTAADIEGVISNPMSMEEESTSAGAGTLLNLEGTATTNVPRQSSGHNFFSQLNWAEQTSKSSEYAPFQDHLGAGSNSSSESGDDTNVHQDPFLSAPSSKENGGPGSGVPFVNFDDFESGSASTRGANGHMHRINIPTPQSTGQDEAKLIEFSVGRLDRGPVQPASNTQATTPTRSKDEKQTKDMFGVSFDPWGTPSTAYQRQYQGKSALEISDLLGLDDSDDEVSTLSDVQSEVRAAGAETFSDHLDRKGMKSNSSDSSATSSQFDPFSTLLQHPTTSSATPQTASSTEPLFNLMDIPAATATAAYPSTTVTTTASSTTTAGNAQDPFGSLFAPTVASQHQQQHISASPRRHVHHSSSPATPVTNLGVGARSSSSVATGPRRVSQPPHFNNHLSPSHPLSSSGGLGSVSSHSQPNLYAFGGGFMGGSHQQLQQQAFVGARAHPSYLGGGSASTSPRSMSPRSSPIPFGAHSSSTGNISQTSTEGGRGGEGQATTAGGTQTSMDPFAQFNLGFMTGTNPPSSMPQKIPSQHQQQQQPVFKPQPTKSAPYQPYYMRQPTAESASVQGGGGGKGGVSQSHARSQGKSKSSSSIGTGSSSVFAPRKPNYNPVIGPESKTGKYK